VKGQCSVGLQTFSKLGGPTIKPGTKADYGYQHATSRRAVYSPVLRNSLPDLLEAFDCADPSAVAQQALFWMNHPWPLEQLNKTAQRFLADDSPDDAARVSLAYRTLLGREPSVAEQQLALEFLGRTQTGETDRRIAWAQFIQVLCSSLEFRYLE
jgi:hypothetical protein